MEEHEAREARMEARYAEAIAPFQRAHERLSEARKAARESQSALLEADWTLQI